ncbi:MAG: CarD family transcriptional regulator [Alphaproteobacteria bacterium]|nr:CarD family transcriptional regulator [Alphaproteobacteria bacterium]
MAKEFCFNPGDFAVYPTHGVGKVVEVTTEEIGGQKLSCVAVTFDKDRAVVRIPMTSKNTGLRPLSTKTVMQSALTTLKGKARIKKAMWSRRSQEYEAKINSGDPCMIAEVVRDLHKPPEKGEQCFGERQIFEKAFDRLSHEFAACESIAVDEAQSRIKTILDERK